MLGVFLLSYYSHSYGRWCTRECFVARPLGLDSQESLTNGDTRQLKGLLRKVRLMALRITVLGISVELSIWIPKLKKITHRH